MAECVVAFDGKSLVMAKGAFTLSADANGDSVFLEEDD